MHPCTLLAHLLRKLKLAFIAAHQDRADRIIITYEQAIQSIEIAVTYRETLLRCGVRSNETATALKIAAVFPIRAIYRIGIFAKAAS